MKTAYEQASPRTRNKGVEADTESDRAVVDTGHRSSVHGIGVLYTAPQFCTQRRSSLHGAAVLYTA